MTTVLGISGSLRAASTNTLLMREALRVSGADTLIEADLRLPLYDGDLEARWFARRCANTSQPNHHCRRGGHRHTRIQQSPVGCSEKRVGLGQPDRWQTVGRQTRRDHVGGGRPRRRRAVAVFIAAVHGGPLVRGY